MKNNRSALTKLLLAATPIALVVGIAFSFSPNVSMAKVTTVMSESPLADGGSDYATYCARCHGNDGRGQTAKGRQTHAGDLTKSSVSDTKGIRMITNGSGEMPEFKSSMNAAQIRGVMAYIHGFRR